jgi:hypothetical protein
MNSAEFFASLTPEPGPADDGELAKAYARLFRSSRDGQAVYANLRALLDSAAYLPGAAPADAAVWDAGLQWVRRHVDSMIRRGSE